MVLVGVVRVVTGARPVVIPEFRCQQDSSLLDSAWCQRRRDLLIADFSVPPCFEVANDNEGSGLLGDGLKGGVVGKGIFPEVKEPSLPRAVLFRVGGLLGTKQNAFHFSSIDATQEMISLGSK
jgi:hypothetical protein